MPAHHAYYIEGPLAAFGVYKEKVRPFYAREYERFGIEEARELQSVASLKHYESGIFLLSVSSFTSEAQQAMLKLFEEPQQGTQFIVLVPHGTLLPTLKSRMMEYPEKLDTAQQLGMGKSAVDGKNSSAGPNGLRGLFYQQAQTFLAASGKERSDFIAKLLRDDEGTRERVRDFVNALEAQLHKRVGEPKAREALADIAMVRDYLRDRSPSLKMLLEHLALAL